MEICFSTKRWFNLTISTFVWLKASNTASAWLRRTKLALMRMHLGLRVIRFFAEATESNETNWRNVFCKPRRIMMDVCTNANLRLDLNISDLSKILNNVQVLHLQSQRLSKNRPVDLRFNNLK